MHFLIIDAAHVTDIVCDWDQNGYILDSAKHRILIAFVCLFCFCHFINTLSPLKKFIEFIEFIEFFSL